jgi:flagellar basal body P-ring protein FlgI
VQSIANALQRFGISIPASVVKSKNVAAVMITAPACGAGRRACRDARRVRSRRP